MHQIRIELKIVEFRPTLGSQIGIYPLSGIFSPIPLIKAMFTTINRFAGVIQIENLGEA